MSHTTDPCECWETLGYGRAATLYRRTQIVLEASRQVPAHRRVPHAAFLSGLWWKLLSFQPERILKCLPNLMCIGNSTEVARLYTPTKFHVEGFSAGSYTGATVVIALCNLFPECPVSATLGAIAMRKGIMGALMELASPGHCDIHLVHAEEDLLCDWHPSPTDRKVIEYRLRCTLVAEADKWMGADKHRYWHWLHCSLPEGRWLLSKLKLSHPDVIPIRDRMAAPLRLASWIRFETVMNQQDWRTAIEQLVPQIHLPDPALLDLLRSCVPEQGISSMSRAQALLLCNFRVGSSEPNACEHWLTEVTRDLFKPIPFREVFVILALFLPQLTFAEGAKLDCKLWYSPAISNELSTIHATPIAQGLQGMHEYKIAFAPNSRAAAFVSPEQPVQSFESLAALPSEQIHIGSQVGRVYRLVLREGSQVFALLVVLLEYVTQPKKKSRQGSLESKVVNTQIQWGLPPSLQQLEVQTVGLPILSLAEVGTTVSADHLLQMATMPLEHKPTALGIPYALPVSYQFEGAEELLHSLHALFGLLATADTPRYCPQASGFGKQLCAAAGTDSAHIMSIALSMVAALQSGRSTLAIATRSLTFLLAWFAITTNLRFGVAHKENPATRAITKLLSSLDLNEDQQTLFIRPVGKEEATANTASTKYDKAMFHSTGLIPGARVVVTTTGLIWEQKGQAHSPLRAHMESVDVLVSEEAQQDMDLKSAFVPAVPRQSFFRILLGDPRQSPGGVADNLREHRTLLLKAPIGLRAKNRWLMPQELPKIACSLLKESGEASLQELMQAAEEVSGKTLGSGWYSREDCPCTLPAGANLQAAYPELRHIRLDTPEGLIAGLGYALTRPGHMFQFHQASAAEERSGLAGVHQWSIMLPTSARVVQEVYEPLIGIHYPMLCNVKNGAWQIGTSSIRAEDQLATGFRFVNWVHDASDPEVRAVPTPAATNAVYRQIEQWLPMTDRETDNVLALTTRTPSAQHLQGFFQQSGRRANAETAVKVVLRWRGGDAGA